MRETIERYIDGFAALMAVLFAAAVLLIESLHPLGDFISPSAALTFAGVAFLRQRKKISSGWIDAVAAFGALSWWIFETVVPSAAILQDLISSQAAISFGLASFSRFAYGLHGGQDTEA
jgi:hypothetical protein